MGTECGRPDRMRSALFVDFDNIYICLEERHGKETAQCFGNQVEKWRGLKNSMHHGRVFFRGFF